MGHVPEALEAREEVQAGAGSAGDEAGDEAKEDGQEEGAKGDGQANAGEGEDAEMEVVSVHSDDPMGAPDVDEKRVGADQVEVKEEPVEGGPAGAG